MQGIEVDDWLNETGQSTNSMKIDDEDDGLGSKLQGMGKATS